MYMLVASAPIKYKTYQLNLHLLDMQVNWLSVDLSVAPVVDLHDLSVDLLKWLLTCQMDW